MPSTFFGLNTAYLGLTAANASLNTTSNNISNVDTEGYSRQHTVQQAAEAIRMFTTYGCAGAGVETLAIERYRDEFYDVKYWNNNANSGEYSVKQYYMTQIENYFRDDETMEGFNTIFNEMYDALAEIKKQAGTNETRTAFVGSAGNLTEYFNVMAGNLQKLQQDVNAEIKVNVEQINSYAQEIATLNKQINVIEVSGGIANELRDQRALVIDKLSEIVDVETEEQQIADPNNPDHKTGTTRFIVKIAGKQTLVDDSGYNQLECVARKSYEKVNQSDVDGLYDIRWTNGNRFSLTNDSMKGKLAGLVQMRDGNNGEYFHGTVSDNGKVRIAGEEFSTVTVSVSADYLKNLDKCTLPENGGVIRLGSRDVYFDSWTFNADYDADSDSYSYSYTFVVSNDPDKDEDIYFGGLKGADAMVGSRIEYQGIPYYMEQMNEWCRSYAQAFNNIIAQDGAIDYYGDPAQYFFMADKADGTQWTFAYDKTAAEAVKNKKSYTISTSDDSYYWLTAFNFNINDNIRKDPYLIATQTGNADEESKYNVVDDLIDLKTSKTRMSFRGSSSGEFLQCILSDIALNAQRANNFTANFENIGKSIETQRMSISGVDNDEEAINLVKYQNAYNLASKMIQVLTEVYDRLILETGV